MDAKAKLLIPEKEKIIEILFFKLDGVKGNHTSNFMTINLSLDLEATMDLNTNLKEDALKQLNKLQQTMKVKGKQFKACFFYLLELKGIYLGNPDSR